MVETHAEAEIDSHIINTGGGDLFILIRKLCAFFCRWSKDVLTQGNAEFEMEAGKAADYK